MSVCRPLALLLPALALLLLTGCGYVHFGRSAAPVTTDAALSAENSDLRVEKKILQRELELARKEGTALRAALENRYADTGTAQTELVTRLTETTRELAALRASYAKLDADRRRLQSEGPSVGTGANDDARLAELKSQLGATEEQLATTTRTFTQLQDETNQLRSEVERVHRENSRLTQQVGELTAQNEQAVAALSQLNSELLAQKEARNRAERETQATRSQLQMVIARSGRDSATSLADARSASAGDASEMNATLRLENAPATDTTPNATLRTNPERLRAAAASLAAENGPRYHLVTAGETLESIAKKYYGKPERWRVIYAANNSLLRDNRSLTVGLRLEIPGE